MSKSFTVNFFLAGAPKCGTTAMARYLTNHPQICMSVPKEPFFFCKDFPILQSRTGINNFEMYHGNCFKDYDPDIHLTVGESSVWYLYSQKAAREIMQYNPRAKFVIMLRNPIELVNSLYSMYLGLGFEYSESLGEALDLEDIRAEGSPVKRHKSSESALFLYSRIAKLGQQLERLYSLVPRDQVKVIIYDQFSSNPQACYQDIISFLGLNPDYGTTTFTFREINSQKKNINKKVIKYFYKNQFLRQSFKPIKQIFGIKSFGLGIAKVPLNNIDKVRMINIFKDDVELLSSLINEDLNHWLT